MPDLPINVVDIVASVELDSFIPIEKLVAGSDGTDEHEQFPGAVYRFKDLGAATIVFPNGRIVCTGTKTIEDATDALKKTLEKLEPSGITVSDPRVEIENIVVSMHLGPQPNLQEMSGKIPGMEYQTGEHPGLLCRMEDAGIVLMLFENGKLICTGAKSMADAQEAVNEFVQKLRGAGVSV